jgi:hypothetical protein
MTDEHNEDDSNSHEKSFNSHNVLSRNLNKSLNLEEYHISNKEDISITTNMDMEIEN